MKVKICFKNHIRDLCYSIVSYRKQGIVFLHFEIFFNLMKLQN